MRPIVSSLLGCLEDVYFGFQKIRDVTSFYSEIRNQIDVWFLCMYQKVLNLSELVQSTEEHTRMCSRQRNWDNTPKESVADYWKQDVAIHILDVICSEFECRFTKEKQAHHELRVLIPTVIVPSHLKEQQNLRRYCNGRRSTCFRSHQPLKANSFVGKGIVNSRR